MKRISQAALWLAFVCSFTTTASSQSITVSIVRPLSNGFLIRDDATLYVAATVTSTYEVQSVQATLGGQSIGLAYTASAYTNCPLGNCTALPGWAGAVPVAGLPRGTNVLKVTAIDAFGNSNSAQSAVVFDRPPTITVTSPAIDSVARPGIGISVAASDDDSMGAKIDVFQDGVGGNLLASGTNTLNTTLNFPGADGSTVVLWIRTLDSVGQAVGVYRRVHVQSSSNLVEIASASSGRIVDVQSDRLLFQTFEQDVVHPDFWTSQTLKIRSRSISAESVAFSKTDMKLMSGLLSPQGATVLASGSPFGGYVTGYGLYQVVNGTELLHGTHGLVQIGLRSKGNFLCWGWGSGMGFTPQLARTDLQTTNTVVVTNLNGFREVSFDVAQNGDVVFAPATGYGSHAIYRFRNGVNTLLASISGNQSTNQLVSPKTDGSNVYYIQITPTNNVLKSITAAGTVTLAEGSAIGGDYLLNNGWVTYGRSASGQTQIWRCSPAGQNTQLTFYGTSSSLASLSPDGEVAFYNGSQLLISKGSWPPSAIATATAGSGLNVFWQDGRWCATLGRSLYQVYSGAPQIASASSVGATFGFDLVGASGQSLVTECTTDLLHWMPIATNQISDGCNLRVQDSVLPDSRAKWYRLRKQ